MTILIDPKQGAKLKKCCNLLYEDHKELDIGETIDNYFKAVDRQDFLWITNEEENNRKIFGPMLTNT